jgi:hypothetical protein
MFIRKKLQLEGRDLEIAKLYERGYVILTTDQDNEPGFCFIFTNSTTFSDVLTRNFPGEKLENGEVVSAYTRDDGD